MKKTSHNTDEGAIRALFEKVTSRLIAQGLTISTMESCTSGFVASLLTDREGASAVYKGGFVTYSNEAKIKAGVPEEIINCYGVYSPETAKAMADAARKAFDTDIAIGITGTFANEDPVNSDSKAYTVYVCVMFREKIFEEKLDLSELKESDRYEMKLYAAGEVCRIIDENFPG